MIKYKATEEGDWTERKKYDLWYHKEIDSSNFFFKNKIIKNNNKQQREQHSTKSST